MTEPTERPTARKLERARARGEAAQSPLATWVLVLAGVGITLAVTNNDDLLVGGVGFIAQITR